MEPMITFKQYILESGQSKRSVQPDGTQVWYYNAKLHRTDGPAVIRPDGTKSWYKNGKLHRLDGPAVEFADGSKIWWVNDKRHRLDGPAIEGAKGYKSWYIDDKAMTEDEFNAYVKQQQVKDIISKNNTTGWDL